MYILYKSTNKSCSLNWITNKMLEVNLIIDNDIKFSVFQDKHCQIVHRFYN